MFSCRSSCAKIFCMRKYTKLHYLHTSYRKQCLIYVCTCVCMCVQMYRAVKEFGRLVTKTCLGEKTLTD